MKSVVVPALLSAFVAGVVSLLVVRSADAPDPRLPTTDGADAYVTETDVTRLIALNRSNPPLTTLTLYMDGDACKAEVDSDPVGNHPEKRVFWYVLNDSDAPCQLKEAHPRIKLVFKPHENKQYPFQNKEVFSKRQNDLVYVHERIKKWGKDPDKEVDYAMYSYAVHLLNGTTTDPNTPVLDPILEVEDSNRNLSPAPLAAPAQAPPAKKQ